MGVAIYSCKEKLSGEMRSALSSRRINLHSWSVLQNHCSFHGSQQSFEAKPTGERNQISEVAGKSVVYLIRKDSTLQVDLFDQNPGKTGTYNSSDILDNTMRTKNPLLHHWLIYIICNGDMRNLTCREIYLNKF